MATAGLDAAGIFADARYMREAALTQMAAGDIRDAAEKAWCATVRATEGLILARTGDEPQTSTAAGRKLRALSETDPLLRELRLRYADRQAVLHGECFYHDYCQPGVTENLILETDDYIQQAELLAGQR